MKSLVTLVICGSMALPASALLAQGASRSRSTARAPGAANAARTGVNVSPTSASRTLGAARSTAVTGIPLHAGSVNTAPATVGAAAEYAPAENVEGTEGLSGNSEEILINSTLSAEQAAALQADLTNSPEIAAMRDAHGELLASVNDVNPEAEGALDNFLATVTTWTCGVACVSSVTDVLASSAEYAGEKVDQGTDIDVATSFSHTLSEKGLYGAVKGQCQGELGPLLTL